MLRLPAIPYQGAVESPDKRDQFQVDLSSHSCTCAEWTERRAKHPAGHVGRACKHLVQLLHGFEEHEAFTPLTRAFLWYSWMRGGGVDPLEEHRVVTVSGTPVLIAFNPVKAWLDIWAPDGDEYSRFGYNVLERRWSFGDAPKGFSGAIRQFVQSSEIARPY